MQICSFPYCSIFATTTMAFAVRGSSPRRSVLRNSFCAVSGARFYSRDRGILRDLLVCPHPKQILRVAFFQQFHKQVMRRRAM